MFFLPYENLTIKTQLDSEEVIKRISDQIEPKKLIRKSPLFSGKSHKPYEGKFTGDTFNVNRIIGYRNSFLPMITGKIESGFSGSKIHIKMKMHTFVIVFLCIWFTGVGFACFSEFSKMQNSPELEFAPLLVFAVIIISYTIVVAVFKYESRKSKAFFLELLEAKVHNDKMY